MTCKGFNSRVSVVDEEMRATASAESEEVIRLGLSDVKSLILKAGDMRRLAYCPYSNFRVGCAILTSTGEVFTGCNVENASYTLTMCAEKVAIGKAVSEGFRKFTAIAVSTDCEDCTSPCGACRQSIREWGNSILIICANKFDAYKAYTMDEILPDSFSAEKLL